MPGGRRIHNQPTPRLGGLAIFISLGVTLWITGFLHTGKEIVGLGNVIQAEALALAATAVTALGVFDDIFSLRPRHKLVVEILAGIVTVAAGFKINQAFGIELGWLAAPVTVLWIIVVVNAVNMIDGLDGLAAGTCLIVGFTLAIVSVHMGHINSLIVLTAFCGVLLGFLPYNFSSARIFLGDSGSLLLGFLLAVLGIESSYKMAVSEAIVVPVLALGFPLSEIGVTILRRLLKSIHVEVAGDRYRFALYQRPALFKADRDHIHHRLLALGFSGRSAVLLLYAACAVMGSAALYLCNRNSFRLPVFFGIAAIIAVALGQLRYEELRIVKHGLLLPLLDLKATQRTKVCIAIDFAFGMIAYVVAVLVFKQQSLVPRLTETLAIAGVQLAVLFIGGVYKRSYRRGGTADYVFLLRVLALAIASAWLLAWAIFGWENPPAGVLVIDGYVLMSLVAGARLAFRVLDYYFKEEIFGSKKAFIYGTGLEALMALDDLRSGRVVATRVIGFINDNGFDHSGHFLRGLPIKSVPDVLTFAGRSGFEELILASNDLDSLLCQNLLHYCGRYGINVVRFSVAYEQVENAVRSTPAGGFPSQPASSSVDG